MLEREPQLFGPWLGLQDRLTLGSCSRRMLSAYDNHVKELALRAPPLFGATAGSSSGGGPTRLPRLGSGARFPRLSVLHVRDSAVLPSLLALLAATSGGWPQLRVLCLKRLRVSVKEVEALAGLMDDGRLRGLAGLDLSDSDGLDADCITAIAEVLARGGTCPGLVELNLRSQQLQALAGRDAMRVALDFLGVALQGRRAQGCKPLQRLHLGVSCMQLVGRLSSSESLSGLRELDLSLASLTEPELQEMGSGLRAAKAPQLDTLRVTGAALVSVESGRTLASALAGGGAPRLRVLELEAVGMAGRAMEALAKAVELGACATLRELTLAKAGLTGAEVEALANAALLCRTSPRTKQPSEPEQQQAVAVGGSGGGGPWQLKVLALNRNRGMGPRGSAALAQALSLGAFPCLEVLNLQDSNIGDVGVGELASAMLSGPAATTTNPAPGSSTASKPCALRLKKLLLGSCEIGRLGAGALASVLSTGACPRLEVLSLSLNRLGPEGVGELARGLSSAACCESRLRVLELNFVEMGDAGAKALMAALGRAHCCPELDRVEVLQWMADHHGHGLSHRVVSRDVMAALRHTLQRRKTSNGRGWPVYVVM